MPADARVFRKGGQHQIPPPALAILVQQAQGAQGFKGGVLHLQRIPRHPAGVVVMDDDERTVPGQVNVGFDAVVAAIASRHKGGGGVFRFKAAGPAVGDHPGLGRGKVQRVLHGENLLRFFSL